MLNYVEMQLNYDAAENEKFHFFQLGLNFFKWTRNVSKLKDMANVQGKKPFMKFYEI